MPDEHCYLYNNCPCQTAVCTGVPLPDAGCPVYRYFRKLIIRELQNRKDYEVCLNCPLLPIRPTFRDNKVYCGQCGKRIPLKIKANYCHKCGRMVNWNV